MHDELGADQGIDIPFPVGERGVTVIFRNSSGG